MGVKISGEVRVERDEKDICRTTLARKMQSDIAGETMAYHKITMNFKGTLPKPKNRAKISIKDGFLTFYSFEKEVGKNQFGESEYKREDRLILFVMDYELLEEGIDEPFRFISKEMNRKAFLERQEQKQNDKNEVFGSITNDNLPF